MVFRFNVRFGSKADICAATSHVRFTPNSDRESEIPQKAMSALAPKADMCSAPADVCFGQERTWGGSFVHLVGGREQRSWHDKAESLGGIEVDRKLVFRRLLKR
jgi:hypothetical protein